MTTDRERSKRRICQQRSVSPKQESEETKEDDLILLKQEDELTLLKQENIALKQQLKTLETTNSHIADLLFLYKQYLKNYG